MAWQHEGVGGCWSDGFLRAGVGFQMSVDKRERDFMPKTVGEEGRKVVWLKEKSGLLLTKKQFWKTFFFF